MKIHGNNYMQKIMAAYNRVSRSAPEKKAEKPGNQEEKVEISSTSRVLYEKMQELKTEEEISVRAREIKELYNSNKYSVSEEELAERMIEVMDSEGEK